MTPALQTVMDIYRRRAKCYDLIAYLFYLVGFREYACHRQSHYDRQHPWELLDRYLVDTSFKKLYFDFAYLAVVETLPGQGVTSTKGEHHG